MTADHVTFFGVGDGWPCADRNHSATLYRLGGTTLLLDCGEPLSRSYAASGLSYDAVDHMLLSHMHADHVGGFQMFMQALWLRGRTKPLTIHLPGEGLVPLRRMLRVGYLFDKLLGFRLSFRTLAARRRFKLGRISVTAHPTGHLAGLRQAFAAHHRQPFEAFSFVLETGQRRIVHSADLGGPADLEPLLRKPVDLLVCELAHFAPADIFRFLRERSVRRVAFTHLSDSLWRRRAAVLKQAKKALPGTKVGIPRDLEGMRL